MKYWYLLVLIQLVIISITAHFSHVLKLDAQQNERIRLECILKSKADAEEAIWMRIRYPYNPDILTYRDSVVYNSNRFELEQRLLSSNLNTNGTFIDTYYLTLTILRPNLDDEGRYVCSKGRHIFAEYDLFIIIPPRFIEQENSIQKQTILEGSTLHLSCSAEGRPTPSITWFYQTNDNKLVLLGDGTACRERICEIFLANYTRHDPTIIECIADNEKTNRIAKVFHIDIHYPPKILTNIRTLVGLKSIEVFIECTSIGNPKPKISWFDDNQQEITDFYLYTIKQENYTSILSFTVYSNEHSRVLFYCRSNNSIGTVEKLINISEFIQLDLPLTTIHPSRKTKKIKLNRTHSKLISTTPIISSTSILSLSKNLFCIFLIIHFIK